MDHYFELLEQAKTFQGDDAALLAFILELSLVAYEVEDEPSPAVDAIITLLSNR